MPDLKVSDTSACKNDYGYKADFLHLGVIEPNLNLCHFNMLSM